MDIILGHIYWPFIHKYCTKPLLGYLYSELTQPGLFALALISYILMSIITYSCSASKNMNLIICHILKALFTFGWHSKFLYQSFTQTGHLFRMNYLILA